MERKVKEIHITSLEKYVKEINKKCFNKKTLFPESIDNIWFRGESKSYPHIAPSLFRGNFNEKNKGISINDESKLIEKVFQFTPDLFSGCRNAIERLVTMQHYLLPTRLLDVTKNPLVALFFACNENEDDDGRVLFVKKQPQSTDFALNIIATIIESFDHNDVVTIDDIYKILIERGLFNKSNDIKIVLKEKVNVCEIVTKPHFYLPKYNNQRIKNQRGAVLCAQLFEFFGDLEIQKKSKRLLKSYINNKSNPRKINFKFHKQYSEFSNLFGNNFFIIDKDYKTKILRELDNYGINEAVVYPEYEHQMQYIKRYCTPIQNWDIDLTF